VNTDQKHGLKEAIKRKSHEEDGIKRRKKLNWNAHGEGKRQGEDR
jgi:hypothetical protein